MPSSCRGSVSVASDLIDPPLSHGWMRLQLQVGDRGVLYASCQIRRDCALLLPLDHAGDPQLAGATGAKWVPHDLHVPVLLHPHPLSKQPVLGEVRVVPVPRGLGTRSTSICCNFPTHDLAASCWTICCR